MAKIGHANLILGNINECCFDDIFDQIEIE